MLVENGDFDYRKATVKLAVVTKVMNTILIIAVIITVVIMIVVLVAKLARHEAYYRESVRQETSKISLSWGGHLQLFNSGVYVLEI